MVPPTAVFSPASLEERLQCDSRGKRRKQPVDLAECELRRLVQYDCRVPDRRDRRAPAVCWPLERLFRR